MRNMSLKILLVGMFILFVLTFSLVAAAQSDTKLNLLLTQGTAGSVVQAIAEGIAEARMYAR